MPNFSANYDFIVNDLVYIIEKGPNAKWRINKFMRPNYSIIRYATKGEAIFKIDDKSYQVKPGDILYFPKNLEYTAFSNPDNPWSFFTVAFHMDFCNEASANSFHDFPLLTHCINEDKFLILFSELNHAWIGKEIGYLIKCRSILMEILYLIIKENHFSTHLSPHHQKIEAILHEIQTNYAKTYQVNELAKKSGLSSSHFRLLFKKATGMTPTQYQNNIKINKARDFLLSGNCNVSEAADNVGFNNIYYFSKIFKKTTGMTPSDYIRHN